MSTDTERIRKTIIYMIICWIKWMGSYRNTVAINRTQADRQLRQTLERVSSIFIAKKGPSRWLCP